MQSLLTLDVARDLVAQQFDASEDETDLALATTSAPRPRRRAGRARTRLADVLHHAADVVAPASYRAAH
ncbi:MAG: hypothetical protein HOQ22_01135 [Nocardioidaceae bacterium]|nr:hypothetical protein [Nocardioidaceae bacterium]NUS49633.1 hypothetical protein [Nocardioidaceae bacterium]